MPDFGERGFYSKKPQSGREDGGKPAGVSPITIVAVMLVFAGFLWLLQNGNGVFNSFQPPSDASATPQVATRTTVSIPAAKISAASPSPSALDSRGVPLSLAGVLRNETFEPELLALDNATVKLTRSIGFAGGKRVETLEFENTGDTDASFNEIVFFPKTLAEKASEIEVDWALPGQVTILDEDPVLGIAIDIKAHSVHTLRFLLAGLTELGTSGFNGVVDDRGQPYAVGSVHFSIPAARFPMDSEDNAKLNEFLKQLRDPSFGRLRDSDARELSKELSKIFATDAHTADAFDEAMQRLKTTPLSILGKTQEEINATFKGELKPPKARKCSEGAITVSEFMPGFYCEEPAQFSDLKGEFDYSIDGSLKDEAGGELKVSFESGVIKVFADFRNRINGGKLDFSKIFLNGTMSYGDTGAPRDDKGNLRTFSFPLRLLVEHDFNDYVVFWPSSLNFKKYKDVSVDKPLVIQNNLPYDLEGAFVLTVCGQELTLPAGSALAIPVSANDKEKCANVLQGGEDIGNGFGVLVSELNVPEPQASSFAAEDYFAPRIADFANNLRCENDYCSCENTILASQLLFEDTKTTLNGIDWETFKRLFNEKTEYDAGALVLSKAWDNCILPAELENFGLNSAHLNYPKITARFHESGEKFEPKNNGFWLGNWELQSNSGKIIESGAGGLDGNWAKILTQKPFIHYVYSQESKKTKLESDEYSYYVVGQK